MKDWEHALQDATKTTEIKPDWSKGWSRKGGALHGQGDLSELIQPDQAAQHANHCLQWAQSMRMRRR